MPRSFSRKATLLPNFKAEFSQEFGNGSIRHMLLLIKIRSFTQIFSPRYASMTLGWDCISFGNTIGDFGPEIDADDPL